MQKVEIQLTLPNQLTLLRVVLAPVFLVLLHGESTFSKWMSLAVFIVAALTDWYDGWMVWIVIFRDFLITGLRTYAEYHDQPIVTSKSAQAKTFGQFVVIYYILFLHVAKNTPSIYAEFPVTIDALMDSRVLFGMMLLVTLTTVGTGVAYLFDNRHHLKTMYDDLRSRHTA